MDTEHKNVPFPRLCNIYGTTLPPSAFVGPFVEIQANCSIGERTRVSSHSFLCEHVHIGPDCFLGHGVMFTNDKFTQPDRPSRLQQTLVGARVRIGSNSTILPVIIGDDSVIGAGSVVTRDVPAGATVAGNPARILSVRDASLGRITTSSNTDSSYEDRSMANPPHLRLVDVNAVNKPYEAGFHKVLDRVLASGRYALGVETAALEQELANFLGVEGHVVCVSSGTAALELVFQQLDIGPGDEFIVQSNAFVASVYAIARSGCRIVMTDVREDGTVDVDDVQSKITEHTRGVLAVHLHGDVVADMPALQRLCKKNADGDNGRLVLVEDCAQALGTTFEETPVGLFGDYACFSFYPTKNLGGIGEGGAVLVRHHCDAENLKELRSLGMRERYQYVSMGTNARMDELQAGFLRLKLPHTWSAILRKRAAESLYEELLEPSLLLSRVLSRYEVAKRSHHSLHLLVYRVRRPPNTAFCCDQGVRLRDELVWFLREAGIEALVHYPEPFFMAHALRGVSVAGHGACAMYMAAEIISLPMHEAITESEVRRVCRGVLDFEAAYVQTKLV